MPRPSLKCDRETMVLIDPCLVQFPSINHCIPGPSRAVVPSIPLAHFEEATRCDHTRQLRGGEGTTAVVYSIFGPGLLPETGWVGGDKSD